MPDQTIEKMNESQIAEALEKHPEWSEVSGQIQRTFQFPGFADSIAFVRKIADYAERVQHHPDMLIRYDKVTLTASTHDAGGITQKDFDLAHESDRLAN
jgi:4a-hydroxytetrahydrobiopterin dehydratase